MRLFVSVDLPDSFADAVADAQAAVDDASGLSPTDPTQAHVTLKFLGDVDESDLDETVDLIDRAVDAAGVEPFECTVAGAGVFPSLEYISVLWLGVGQGADELTALHEAIEPRAVEAGFDSEDHEFTPHATIGRMNHAGGKKLVQSFVKEEHPEIGTFTAEEIRLKESTLHADGPEYSTVERFEL